MNYSLGKGFKKSIKYILLFFIGSVVPQLPIFQIPILDIIANSFPQIQTLTMGGIVVLLYNWFDHNWLKETEFGQWMRK